MLTELMNKRYWRRLGKYTLGYIATSSGTVGIYAWLGNHYLERMPWQFWAILLILCAYLVGVSIVTLRFSTAADSKREVQRGGLYQSLPSILRNALNNADYREVIRIGDALSRPLFESGEFDVTLQLGFLTEEAAAHLGARDVQYRTLIDAIGWSLIELGSFDDAQKYLRHGLTLAEEEGDYFYQAKAYRHMGAIERRMGLLDNAIAYFEKASQTSLNISVEEDAKAMSAGITYAIAHLKFSQREYKGALKYTDLAINSFKETHDTYRVDMALVLKADIQVALDQVEKAKDIYRQVIQSSRVNRESIHYARAVLGLVEISLRENNFDEASRVLARLDSEHTTKIAAFSERYLAAKQRIDTRV